MAVPEKELDLEIFWRVHGSTRVNARAIAFLLHELLVREEPERLPHRLTTMHQSRVESGP
jgi:hypothetical protein